MALKEIRITFEEIPNRDSLDSTVNKAISEAVRLCRVAYAPYSKFQVGAIVELEDGTLVEGNNQENIAYPSGLCAERVALFSAAARYPGMALRRLFLTAADHGKLLPQPIYPCGACRQVMVDMENRQGANMEIWMAGTEMIHRIGSASDLLPLQFEWNGIQDPA